MKIQLNVLDYKSIDKAIKQLEKQKKLVQTTMKDDVLKWCCEWLIDRANYYISLTDIGANVKQGIIDGWEIQKKSSSEYLLVNTHEKAVYVEFGVGIAGQQNPHENASETGYAYNVESAAKDESGQWEFWANAADLDLPQSALNSQTKRFRDTRGRLHVYSTGTKGTMYAYNALIDLKEYGMQEIADKVKNKYWS